MNAIADLLHRIKRLEADTARLKTWEARGGGGGKPYATVVVAAADSLAADASRADLVCDGENDEEEINQALATGGRVLLLDGYFNLAAPVSFGQGAHLAGMGRRTTMLAASADAAEAFPMFVQTGSLTWCSLSGFTAYGNRMFFEGMEQDFFVSEGPGSQVFEAVFSDLYVYDFARGGFRIDAFNRARIENVRVQNVGGDGVFLRSATESRVAGCALISCGGSGIRVVAATRVRISGNLVRACAVGVHVGA